MSGLIGLLPDNILALGEKSYHLLDIAGEGGSSIVYLARPANDISSDYVIVKEFLPRGYDIERETEDSRIGSLLIPQSRQGEINILKSRVMRESEIVKELRDDRLRYNDDSKTNSGWFLSYSKPIEANNTLYTIITTESGEMLSKKIENGDFKDFVAACDCVLKVLDALRPIHEKGFLHLDISPDNIHFSDSGIARLIDYNSAFRMGIDSQDWIPSYKKGYSAHELTHISHTKSIALSRPTDLYSVAAIFFRLLIGRIPQEGDWRKRSQWELGNDSGYLAGASNLLVKKTNDFLRKGLSLLPVRRFQDIEEMRAELDELIKLKSELQLVNYRKRPNSHFVGRKTKMEEIYQILQNDNYVFLEGIGGGGKTELSKKYVEMYESKYNTVQFVRYSGDLLTTVAYSLRFHNFDATKYEALYGKEEAAYHIFRDKMDRLTKCGSDVLIVIDNYDVVDDDKFGKFTSGKYKVLFTSRKQHGNNVVEVSRMENADDLLDLFREYYKPAKLAVKDEAIVNEIIDLVQGHTMTVMLIATAMRENEKTPGVMLERLKNGLDAGLPTGFTIDKEDVSTKDNERIMYQHILTLFDMAEIVDNENENYSYIMAHMAIVPYAGLEKKTFYRWALSSRYTSNAHGDEDYTDLNWLIKRRWVQFDEESRYVSLHPVISDVAYRMLKPDSVKCWMLINGMIDETIRYTDESHVKKNEYIRMLELPVKRINDNTELTATLVIRIAQLHDSLANYLVALEYFKRTAVICETLFGERDSNTVSIYSAIGNVYAHQGEYDTALEWHHKCLKISKKVFWKWAPHDAIVCKRIADIYYYQGKNIKAFMWYQKASVIADVGASRLDDDSFVKEEAAEIVASIYNGMALVKCEMQNYSEALTLYHKALAIFENAIDFNHPEIANIYSNIGDVFIEQEKYSEALERYYKALEVIKMISGEEHPDTADLYVSIGRVYYRQRDYSKALIWCQKALTIYEKVLGTKHVRTTTAYVSIANSYDKIGDHIRAEEYRHKATRT